MKVVEETDTRFYIKESTVPKAGRGLFAKERLKKGDYLEIIGMIVKENSVADDCTAYGNNYKFQANPDSMKFKVVPFGYAGIVNHSQDKHKRNVEIAFIGTSVKRSPWGTGVVYRFTRDIAKDEELLTDYGLEYTKNLAWMIHSEADLEKVKDDWEVFISHDLYDLGRFKSI